MNETEQKARSMGWVPAEEFRGDPAKHISADEFVQRGETLLPLVKSQNRRLEQQVNDLQGQLRHVTGMFQASQESIVALQEMHQETMTQALQRQKQELTAQLAAAREDGDTVAELQIQEDLDDVRDKLRNPPKPSSKQEPQQQPQQQPVNIDPDLQAWMGQNPWFGSDPRKTQKALGLANVLRSENPDLVGAEFYAQLDAELSGQTQHQPKVGGGRPSGNGGGGSSGGRAYSDLPPDAKAACDRQARKLVGEGRAFKDMSQWQSYYAKQYFRGEE